MLLTFEVTNLLQEMEIDIINGIHLIAALHNGVNRRAEVDDYHGQYYNKALQLVNEVMEPKNILAIEEIHRVISTQYHAKIPGSSSHEYYQNNITIPIICLPV